MECTCLTQTDFEPVSIIIAVFALLVSALGYWESRRIRIEQGRSYLSAEIFQIDSKIYVMLSNIGNTFAYNLQVNIPDSFVNPFQNLKVIRPKCSYRYHLLDRDEIASYPEIVTITITYNDYYSKKKTIKKEFEFHLEDYLKANIDYDPKFDCFDIKKSF